MRTLIATTALALLAALPAAGEFQGSAPDTVTRWRAGEWTVWRIDRPTPAGLPAGHAAIGLHPSDRVLLDAGGCVRTPAGWRPFLEAARVEVPGATGGMVALKDVLRRELRVADVETGARLQLRLPEAEGASYAGPRPAAGECAGQPDAYVFVGVQRSMDVSSGPAHMDVVWSGASDPNGVWLNPKWGRQATHPGSLADPQTCFNVPGWFSNPLCTGQWTNIDEPTGVTWLICYAGSTTPIEGHVNWRPGTYTGPIYWSDKSFDQDYNMRIPPPDRNGLTIYNTTSIKGEFDSRETINNFTSPWWVQFRNASDATKKAMVDGRPAIMSGLIGVDCEHDCYSEVHPVWALAMQVNNNPTNDTWAVFARNWGNEGFCSRYQHLVNFPSHRFTFKLPWRPGATSVALTTGTGFWANKSGMSWWWGYVPGDRVTLTIQLLSPYSYGRVHGELHLRWSGPGLQAEGETVPVAAAPDADDQGGGHAERWLAEVEAGLDGAQRAIFETEAAVGSTPPTADQAPLLRRSDRAERETVLAEASTATVEDPATAADNVRRVLALRKAYGRPLPGTLGEIIERALQRAGWPRQ